MSTLVSEALAKQVRFDEDTMWVDLVDGRTLGVPLAYFPRLLNATPAERMKYVVSGGGTGLHWDDLDEDISVPALLLGVGDRTRKAAPWRTSKLGIARPPSCRPPTTDYRQPSFNRRPPPFDRLRVGSERSRRMNADKR